MKVFEFHGEPVNLGRFGLVNKGQVLVLTEKEAEDIKRDRRFKPVKKQPETELPEDDARKIRVLEVQAMNQEAAKQRINELQADGRATDVQKTASHSQMITAILKAEGLTD